MNNILKVAALTAVIMAASVSCKEKANDKENTETEEMARGDYSAKENLVTVQTIKRTDFNKQLVCNGRLEAIEKAAIQFGTSGRIEKINVREGERVEKGQTLATLDMTEADATLRQARLSYTKAEMTLADKLLDYGYSLQDTALIPEAQKRLIYLNSGFEDAQMALESAERTYSQCKLKAPFSGKVASLTAHGHEQAGAFCTLIDDSRFIVRFSVLETEYSFVSVGQRVKVSAFMNNDLSLEGRVVSVNPTVDQNGQIAVTAQIPGHKSLLDGMNVRVMLESSIPGQLVVPKSAVVVRDGMQVLFRYVDGRSLWTYVNVLMSNSTEHAVEANADRGAELSEGDIVIVSGNLNLGDDSPVAIEE